LIGNVLQSWRHADIGPERNEETTLISQGAGPPISQIALVGQKMHPHCFDYRQYIDVQVHTTMHDVLLKIINGPNRVKR
jgi:hypothetical protein